MERLPGVLATRVDGSAFRVQHRGTSLGTYDSLEKANSVKHFLDTYCTNKQVPKDKVRSFFINSTLAKKLPLPVNGRSSFKELEHLSPKRFHHSAHATKDGQEIPVGVNVKKGKWTVTFRKLHKQFDRFEDAKTFRLFLEKNCWELHDIDQIMTIAEKAIKEGLIPRPNARRGKKYESIRVGYKK